MTTETPEKTPEKPRFLFSFSATPYLNKVREGAKQLSSAVRNKVTTLLPPAQEKPLDVPQAEKNEADVVVTATKEIEDVSVVIESAINIEVAAAVVTEAPVVESKARKLFNAIVDFAVPPRPSRPQNIPSVPEKPISESTNSLSPEQIPLQSDSVNAEDEQLINSTEEPLKVAAPTTSIFSRALQAVKESKPLDTFSSWAKRFLPEKKASRPLFRDGFSYDETSDLPPGSLSSFAMRSFNTEEEMEARYLKLDRDFSDTIGVWQLAVDQFQESVLNGILGKRNNVHGISSARPNQKVISHLCNSFEEYQLAVQEKSEVKIKAALDKAASTQWWNSGVFSFLKNIPGISYFHRKLVDETQVFFEGTSVFEEFKTNLNLDADKRELTTQKAQYYRENLEKYYTGDWEASFTYIHSNRKNLIEWEREMVPLEEVVRLSKRIKGLEARLDSLNSNEENHAEDLKKQIAELKDQKRELFWKIRDSKIEPVMSSALPTKAQIDRFRDEWGDLVDGPAEDERLVDGSVNSNVTDSGRLTPRMK